VERNPLTGPLLFDALVDRSEVELVGWDMGLARIVCVTGISG
jgi:hypothetical protein